MSLRKCCPVDADLHLIDLDLLAPHFVVTFGKKSHAPIFVSLARHLDIWAHSVANCRTEMPSASMILVSHWQAGLCHISACFISSAVTETAALHQPHTPARFPAGRRSRWSARCLRTAIARIQHPASAVPTCPLSPVTPITTRLRSRHPATACRP